MSYSPSPTDKPEWCIYFDSYDSTEEARREVLFAQGNGVLVCRASSTLWADEKWHYPATYYAGCYEDLQSRICGEEDTTESLVRLPDWTALEIVIDDEVCLSIDRASDQFNLNDYQHGVNLKQGYCWRIWTTTDQYHRSTRISEKLLVSMAFPNVCATALEIVPLNWNGKVHVRSYINGDVVNHNVRRYAGHEQRHMQVVSVEKLNGNYQYLLARTCRSGQYIQQIVKTSIKNTGEYPIPQPAGPDEHIFFACVKENNPLIIEKHAFISASTYPDTSIQKRASDTLETFPEFEELITSQRRCWKTIWRQVMLESENVKFARLLHFHAFHLLQTLSPQSVSLDVGVPSRGWHGEGYRGHIFWDELFILPFFNFHFPEIAKAKLMYRVRRLPQAQVAAQAARYQGAMYPWRSASTGEEVTPRYQKNLINDHWMNDPTRRQRHVGAAIVYNIWHYYLVTADRKFLLRYGAEIIVEVARFWASIVHYNKESARYEIHGVIGPDEYHNQYPHKNEPGLNNNTYTNIMAVWTLCRALELEHILTSQEFSRLQKKLNITREELQLWNNISRRMYVGFIDENIISQFDGFGDLERFSPKQLPEEIRDKRIDWALESIGLSADYFQTTKQADTLTLFYLLRESEISDIFARLGYSYRRTILLATARYYLERTSHRSSLSKVVYASALAGADPEESWEQYQGALHTDLHSMHGQTTDEGIHLGAMGAALDLLQRHYFGVWPSIDGLIIQPTIPGNMDKTRINLIFRQQLIELESGKEDICIKSSRNNFIPIRLLLENSQQISLAPGAQLTVKNCLVTR